MMKEKTISGESFMVYSELIEIAAEMVIKKPLTPLRVCKIRHCVENAWVNLNIEYTKGNGHFSDAMFQYYLHRSFELEYGTLIN